MSGFCTSFSLIFDCLIAQFLDPDLDLAKIVKLLSTVYDITNFQTVPGHFFALKGHSHENDF
jgi:hypothetical protein